MRRPIPPLVPSAAEVVVGEVVVDPVCDVDVACHGVPGARSFRLTGSDGGARSFEETPRSPYVVSSSSLFDAMFALAVTEAREASVARIQNDAFRAGAPLKSPPGGWFETGEKWNYVWTRDTAYAVELGLCWFDPVRSANSLDFKLSERRGSLGGGGLAIVADTGSGGSYPISSDRVTWAMGAARLLPFLDEERRADFAIRTEEALDNTLSRDRLVVFDDQSGLYRGEQSFLDWREQSYPGWTAEDTAHIGKSAALSTNVAHAVALRLAARLARELGKTERAERRLAQANALARRIHERFFLGEWGIYGTYLLNTRDARPELQLDLLGTSLAVEFGITPEEERQRVIGSYPRLPHGPPVIWPAQPEIPIYHNRALWPFVTAYHLRAARRAGHATRASAAFMSLLSGAARHRSNLENAEMASGAAHFEDGAWSGPVINSARQLWSVAGYLSAVVDGLFGMEANDEGLTFHPYVPVTLAQTLGLGSSLRLEGLVVRARTLAVVLHMEAPSPTGAWVLGRGQLDGLPLAAGATVPWSGLHEGSRLELWLEPDRLPAPSECYVDVSMASQRAASFAPLPVEIGAVSAVGESVMVEFHADPREAAQVKIEVLRDGIIVATGIAADSGRYVDVVSPSVPHRYVVRAYFEGTGHRSMPSREFLFLGGSSEMRCLVDEPEAKILRIGPLCVERAGEYALTLLYTNGNGGFTTGITCALRRARLFESTGSSESLLAQAILSLPHTGGWDCRLESSPLFAKLEPGAVHWLLLDMTADTENMSFYEHFSDYTAGQGGRDGPSNRARVFEWIARPSPTEPQPGT